jgi:hypothetical protein
MAIMWGYDAVLDMPLVREAMHNRAKAFCPGGCDPSTAEGSLRYLSVFAQSGRDRIKAWKLGTDPIGPGVLDYEPNIVAGTNIVEAVKSSNVDNVNSLPAMAPFDYGNISLDYSVFPTMVSRGWVLDSLEAPSGNTFFVLSKCQYYFSQAVRFPKQDDPNPVKLNQTWYDQYCS